VERHDGTFHDVSEGPNLVTIVPQGAGHVSDRQYYAGDADDNKSLTAYSIFTDPCDGTTHVFTVEIKVLPDAANDE